MKVDLRETRDSLKLVKQIINGKYGVLVAYNHLVKLSIQSIMDLFFFFTNNIEAPHGEVLERIKPLSNKSYNCPFNSLNLAGAM